MHIFNWAVLKRNLKGVLSTNNRQMMFIGYHVLTPDPKMGLLHKSFCKKAFVRKLCKKGGNHKGVIFAEVGTL